MINRRLRGSAVLQGRRRRARKSFQRSVLKSFEDLVKEKRVRATVEDFNRTMIMNYENLQHEQIKGDLGIDDDETTEKR